MKGLRRKILLVSLAAILGLATCVGLSLHELYKWNAAMDYLMRDNLRAALDGNFQVSLNRAVAETASYLLTRTDEYRSEAENALHEAGEALTELRRVGDEIETEPLPADRLHGSFLDRQEHILARVREAIAEAHRLAANGTPAPAELLEVVFAHEPESDRLWQDLGEHHVHERIENEAEVRLHEYRVLALLTASGVLVLVWLVALIAFVGRRIVGPLNQLSELAEAVARGDLTPRAPIGSQDEVGVLQRAFNHMVVELREQREAVARKTDELADTVRSLSEARAAAESASRAKSQFLANVSHEIRTPMNGVFLTLDMLHETGLDDEQERYVKLARSSAQSLLGLINDVLDLSKIEAGKLELERVGFDLRALLAQVTGLNAERATAKGLHLDCDIDPMVPRMAQGDPLRLGQVLTNLLDNAIKFTERGHVSLHVQRLGAPAHAGASPWQGVSLRFTVRDTGIGIDSEKQAQVFNAFYQADGATSRKYGGTGLGLAISRQLVALMGGEIGVDSTPGSGSAFWFTARLAAAEDDAHGDGAAGGERALRLSRAARVLLVDDSDENREVTAAMLARLGLQVESVGGGVEAIAAACRERFDLILMDCMMPEVDGFEATRRIREAANGEARVPIVALTAQAFEDAKDRCLQAGMDDYLAKPFSRAELVATLRRWLH